MPCLPLKYLFCIKKVWQTLAILDSLSLVRFYGNFMLIWKYWMKWWNVKKIILKSDPYLSSQLLITKTFTIDWGSNNKCVLKRSSFLMVNVYSIFAPKLMTQIFLLFARLSNLLSKRPLYHSRSMNWRIKSVLVGSPPPPPSTVTIYLDLQKKPFHRISHVGSACPKCFREEWFDYEQF